jgi:hypothetical protein
VKNPCFYAALRLESGFAGTAETRSATTLLAGLPALDIFRSRAPAGTVGAASAAAVIDDGMAGLEEPDQDFVDGMSHAGSSEVAMKSGTNRLCRGSPAETWLSCWRKMSASRARQADA